MEKNIEWMYDGPKSLVNREDYLLGKKIDKNFELFSDVVIKDKDETEERFAKPVLNISANTPTSSLEILGLDVVRTEDPLVAIRMQKEQRKRAILQDPLFKLKARRLLREAQERELNGKKQKKKKSKRKRSPSSTSSSSSSFDHKHKKREKKNMKNHKHNHCHFHRSPSLSCISGHHRDRDFQFSKSDSRSRNITADRSPRHESLQDLRKNDNRSSKPQMTREEMEIKRQAMLSNVQWRDEIRNKTIKNAAERLRVEEEEIEKSQGNGVAMLIGNVTTASSSVEQRLQSRKHTLQRSHNYMEKSFTRK